MKKLIYNISIFRFWFKYILLTTSIKMDAIEFLKKNKMKKLNWELFLFVLIISFLGAVSRVQDTSLGYSFIIFCIFGIPLSIPFLFINFKKK